MAGNNAFGEKVRHFRHLVRHWTQERLAEESDLSQAEVSKIENGHVKGITEETVRKLARAFEIGPERLAHGTQFASFFGEADLVPGGIMNEGPPLTAYFASALTGLSPDQLVEMKALDQRVDDVCGRYESFPLVLYRPRLKTSPHDNPTILAHQVYDIDSERVASSDLLILAAIFPSLGAGMELQIAYQCCTSVILLTKEGQSLSKMATGCPARKEIVTYKTLDDIPRRLQDAFDRITPIINEYRFAHQHSGNESIDFELGNRIRQLRELRKVSQTDLARMVAVDVGCIEALESKPEQISNPSLRTLRRVARALMTSDAYLLSGYAIPIHLTNPIFTEHLHELRSFAQGVEMPMLEYEYLWNEHVEQYKEELSVVGVERRVDAIGTKGYWAKKHENFKIDISKGDRLF